MDDKREATIEVINESIPAIVYLYTHGIIKRTELSACFGRLIKLAHESNVALRLEDMLKNAFETDPKDLLKGVAV